MIDEIGRTLEIQRVRQMIEAGQLRSPSGKIIEEEKDGMLGFIDAESREIVAVVLFSLKHGKYRTLVRHKPTKLEPLRTNFVHRVKIWSHDPDSPTKEVFDEATYNYHIQQWKKSGESFLPMIRRPKEKKEKTVNYSASSVDSSYNSTESETENG